MKKNIKQQLAKAINSFQKQIKNLGKLGARLEIKEKELERFVKNLEGRVDTRTSAERVINTLLHKEIEQRKQSEQAAQDALEYADSIIDTVREPFIVLNADLKVISANRSFYQIFSVKAGDTENQYIYDLGNHQWDIPELRELLEDILPNTTSFDNYEVEHIFRDIGKRAMLLNARKVYRKANQTQLILLAIEDITKRKEAEEKLKTMANHDELTGCVNFRSIMKLLENEIARSKRFQKKFSIIMMDIDQFKKINDGYGHIAGNDALVVFANVIKNNVRNVDIVGRYGGDEFIVILPETDPQHVLVILERIRNDFNQRKIVSPHTENAKEITLKFTAGIAVFPDNAKDLKELIWVVDSALRQAKREGKNRTLLEKRRLLRCNPVPGTKIEIVDRSDKQNVKSINISNISKKGMLLLSTQDILDEEFLCRIHPPKGESPFELTSKVKHKSKSENELHCIGVYFPEISENLKGNLSNCIESPITMRPNACGTSL
ncbi:MAG: sensor domain-containing diguanylate cyclase [Deltaproteobacteria bacterium]|nr:sensor domain-containing diguanylate cyclase [Deltaproteobacteria bacterium]